MKSLKLFGLAALLSLALAGSQALAQNLLVNPGFEQPITMDGPPFVGSWEGFQGGDPPVTASASNSTDSPRTGAQSLKLVIAGSLNNFAGAFQDVAVAPGTQVTYSGWHRTPSSPLDVVTEIRIEWKLANGNNNGDTGNQLPIATAAYSQFSMIGTAPANTAFARVVYAIQTFSDGRTHTGTVYVDDMSLTAVPEPASLSLIGAGALATLRRRRAR